MKIYHISYRKSRAITAAVIGAGSTALDKPGSSLDVLLAEPGLSINMNQKTCTFCYQLTRDQTKSASEIR